MAVANDMTVSLTAHSDALVLPEAEAPGLTVPCSRQIRLFVADAPALLSRIELGHERRDLAEISQAAQVLRASAQSLGATELADAAHRLEHLEVAQCGCNAAELRLAQLRVCLRDALLHLLEPVQD